jgi:hypothetical protein
VVVMVSPVSMLSFTRTGTPWRGSADSPFATLKIESSGDLDCVPIRFKDCVQFGSTVVLAFNPTEVPFDCLNSGELSGCEELLQVTNSDFTEIY